MGTPGEELYEATTDIYLAFVLALERIVRYADLTLVALHEYRASGGSAMPRDHSPREKTRIWEVMRRTDNVNFLRSDEKNADAHVYGQATISAWSALEVFVGDVLLAVVVRDRSSLKSVPLKVKPPSPSSSHLRKRNLLQAFSTT